MPVRDRVVKFNASGPDGLVDRKSLSRRSKKFDARLDEIAREKGIDPADIEIWFADEARIGQKNKIARRWAKARHAAQRTERPEHGLDLHLWRHLPQARQGRWPCPALLQHRRHEPAPGRDRHRRRAGEAEIVAVLGGSSFTYAEAGWTPALLNWIGALVRMFRFFEGVPCLIVPSA